MEYTHLSNTVGIKTISEDSHKGIFEIEGLYAGYGLTIGNAVRRALLSSLPGAAVTQIKIRNVSHEFSTLPGVQEDMVELSLNFKRLRFNMHADEPRVLNLKVKGQKEVTGKDVQEDAEVAVVNPDIHLATLTAKDAEVDLEITVERGLGYSAVETRKSEKLPVGVIAIDAHFSPVTQVNFSVEDMRVGDRTDYNRVRLSIETDGSITPSSALHKASVILADHFTRVGDVAVKEHEASPEPATPKKKAKKSKE